MMSKVVRCTIIALAGGALSLAGCGSDSVTFLGADATDQQELGRLHLPLVTGESDKYRLAEAFFDIVNHDQTLTVTSSSDADPNAVALDVELPQDTYTLTLRGGWRLERIASDGTATSVFAALLTPNPTSFQIVNQQVTQVLYRFTADDGLVSFGSGSLEISLDFTPTTGVPACNLLNRSTCPSGQTCLLADATGRTFCAAPGELPVGSPCSSEQCVAGAQCLHLDAQHPELAVCTQFCNPASLTCGCRSLDFSSEVGVCTRPFSGFVFGHVFQGGVADSAACDDWNDFRRQLLHAQQVDFDRVTMRGSLDGVVACNDPVVATRICKGLAEGDYFEDLQCEAHNWSMWNCGGGPGGDNWELRVDDGSTCGCGLHAVRPCNGANFGGFGVNTCNSIAQALEVTCE